MRTEKWWRLSRPSFFCSNLLDIDWRRCHSNMCQVLLFLSFQVCKLRHSGTPLPLHVSLVFSCRIMSWAGVSLMSSSFLTWFLFK
jgi:hypothetical protein